MRRYLSPLLTSLFCGFCKSPQQLWGQTRTWPHHSQAQTNSELREESQISGKTAGEMWFIFHYLGEANSLWQPTQKNCLVVTLFIFARPFFFFFSINYSSSLCQNHCGVTETNPSVSCSDLKAHISSLLVILRSTEGNLRSAAYWKTAQSSFNPDPECRRITLSILKQRHITSLSLT